MEKNTSKCLRKQAFFVKHYVQYGEEREKNKKASAGHERDKLIESYNVQPTIEQQFEPPSIISRFIRLIQENSSQFNLFLQMGHIISSTFFLWLPQLPPDPQQHKLNPGFANSPLM